MAHKGQQAIAIAKRRAEAAALYLRGYSQLAIAEQLGVNQSTIHKDLKNLLEEWRDLALRDTHAARSAELERLRMIEQQAWDQWERSKLDAETRTERTTEDGGEVTVRTQGQCGDPRYLDVVHRAIAKRCELLGLDAPKRTEFSAPGGGPIGVVVAAVRADELSDDELAAIAMSGRTELTHEPANTPGGFPRLASPPESPDSPA